MSGSGDGIGIDGKHQADVKINPSRRSGSQSARGVLSQIWPALMGCLALAVIWAVRILWVAGVPPTGSLHATERGPPPAVWVQTETAEEQPVNQSAEGITYTIKPRPQVIQIHTAVDLGERDVAPIQLSTPEQILLPDQLSANTQQLASNQQAVQPARWRSIFRLCHAVFNLPADILQAALYPNAVIIPGSLGFTGLVDTQQPQTAPPSSASASLATPPVTHTTGDQLSCAIEEATLPLPQPELLPKPADSRTSCFTSAPNSSLPMQQANSDVQATAAPSESRREKRRARRREKKAEVTHHLCRLGSIARSDIDAACTAATSAWSDVSSTAVDSFGAAHKAVQIQVSNFATVPEANVPDSSSLSLEAAESGPASALSVDAASNGLIISTADPDSTASKHTPWFLTVWPWVGTLASLIGFTFVLEEFSAHDSPSSFVRICILAVAAFFSKHWAKLSQVLVSSQPLDPLSQQASSSHSTPELAAVFAFQLGKPSAEQEADASALKASCTQASATAAEILCPHVNQVSQPSPTPAGDVQLLESAGPPHATMLASVGLDAATGLASTLFITIPAPLSCSLPRKSSDSVATDSAPTAAATIAAAAAEEPACAAMHILGTGQAEAPCLSSPPLQASSPCSSCEVKQQNSELVRTLILQEKQHLLQEWHGHIKEMQRTAVLQGFVTISVPLRELVDRAGLGDELSRAVARVKEQMRERQKGRNHAQQQAQLQAQQQVAWYVTRHGVVSSPESGPQQHLPVDQLADLPGVRLEQVVLQHQQQEADLTMLSSEQMAQLEFGILDSAGLSGAQQTVLLALQSLDKPAQLALMDGPSTSKVDVEGLLLLLKTRHASVLGWQAGKDVLERSELSSMRSNSSNVENAGGSFTSDQLQPEQASATSPAAAAIPTSQVPPSPSDSLITAREPALSICAITTTSLSHTEILWEKQVVLPVEAEVPAVTSVSQPSTNTTASSKLSTDTSHKVVQAMNAIRSAWIDSNTALSAAAAAAVTRATASFPHVDSSEFLNPLDVLPPPAAPDPSPHEDPPKHLALVMPHSAYILAPVTELLLGKRAPSMSYPITGAAAQTTTVSAAGMIKSSALVGAAGQKGSAVENLSCEDKSVLGHMPVQKGGAQDEEITKAGDVAALGKGEAQAAREEVVGWSRDKNADISAVAAPCVSRNTKPKRRVVIVPLGSHLSPVSRLRTDVQSSSVAFKTSAVAADVEAAAMLSAGVKFADADTGPVSVISAATAGKDFAAQPCKPSSPKNMGVLLRQTEVSTLLARRQVVENWRAMRKKSQDVITGMHAAVEVKPKAWPTDSSSSVDAPRCDLPRTAVSPTSAGMPGAAPPAAAWDASASLTAALEAITAAKPPPIKKTPAPPLPYRTAQLANSSPAPTPFLSPFSSLKSVPQLTLRGKIPACKEQPLNAFRSRSTGMTTKLCNYPGCICTPTFAWNDDLCASYCTVHQQFGMVEMSNLTEREDKPMTSGSRNKATAPGPVAASVPAMPLNAVPSAIMSPVAQAESAATADSSSSFAAAVTKPTSTPAAPGNNSVLAGQPVPVHAVDPAILEIVTVSSYNISEFVVQPTKLTPSASPVAAALAEHLSVPLSRVLSLKPKPPRTPSNHSKVGGFPAQFVETPMAGDTSNSSKAHLGNHLTSLPSQVKISLAADAAEMASARLSVSPPDAFMDGVMGSYPALTAIMNLGLAQVSSANPTAVWPAATTPSATNLISEVDSFPLQYLMSSSGEDTDYDEDAFVEENCVGADDGEEIDFEMWSDEESEAVDEEEEGAEDECMWWSEDEGDDADMEDEDECEDDVVE